MSGTGWKGGTVGNRWEFASKNCHKKLLESKNYKMGVEMESEIWKSARN